MANGYKLYGRGEWRGMEYTDDTIGRMHGWQEECACSYCRHPLFEGDRAIMFDDGEVYCNRACSAKDGRDLDEIEEIDQEAAYYAYNF